MNWSCKLTLGQRKRDGGGGQPPVKSEVHMGLGFTAVQGSFMAAQSSGFLMMTTSSVLLLHEHKDDEHHAHCWINPQSII